MRLISSILASTADHGRGIGAEELYHHAGHYFFHAVAGLYAAPDGPANAHLCYLVEKDGEFHRRL